MIEVPADAVRRETESVTAQFARVARIPGFRPGHAPASLIRNHFRDDIKSEVVQALVPRFFEDAVKSQKLNIVGKPRFEELKFEEDSPLTCKATFEVYPEFELKEYKGLEADEEVQELTEADVAKALEGLRERGATLEVVADRPAADGDEVTVSYRGVDTQNASARPLEAREAVVHLGGKGTVGAFQENLLGARAGESKEFDVTYPEGYVQKSIAGKTYHFQVIVGNVRRKVLPALDDELAKTVSEFATLEELRGKVREDLAKARREQARNAAINKLVEKLLEGHQFPVPEALLEAQLDHKLERTLAQLITQGIDPRTIDMDWRKFREEARPEAEKEARASIILERIADAEKVEITPEELDEVVRDMAAERHETPAALKTRLTRDGGLDKIAASRRSQKVLELVYNSATIRRKDGERQGPEQVSESK